MKKYDLGHPSLSYKNQLKLHIKEYFYERILPYRTWWQEAHSLASEIPGNGKPLRTQAIAFPRLFPLLLSTSLSLTLLLPVIMAQLGASWLSKLNSTILVKWKD